MSESKPEDNGNVEKKPAHKPQADEKGGLLGSHPTAEIPLDKQVLIPDEDEGTSSLPPGMRPHK